MNGSCEGNLFHPHSRLNYCHSSLQQVELNLSESTDRAGQRFITGKMMGLLTSLPGEVSPRGLSSVGGKQEESSQQSRNALEGRAQPLEVQSQCSLQTLQCKTLGSSSCSVSPSTGVGEGVGAGEGDSVSWSSVPRFLPSRDLAMTIWALRASCSKDFMLE